MANQLNHHFSWAAVRAFVAAGPVELTSHVHLRNIRLKKTAVSVKFSGYLCHVTAYLLSDARHPTNS